MHDLLLKKIEQNNKPVDVVMSGLGFMGFGFLSGTAKLQGIRVPLVITRREEESKRFLEDKGYEAVIESNPRKIKQLADQGKICVSSNMDLVSDFDNKIVIEMTGTVAYGAEVALKAIAAKKHVITMNPELQVTVGTELQLLANQKKVIFTDVYGDQPGSLARLIYQSRLRGFHVLMAGNMKRYLDLHATQEQMAPWAKDKGLAVRQTTSFTDGTKQSIEMNLVANYFGFQTLQRGMVGPQVENIQEVLTKFDWKNIPQEGVVDYVIGKSLFPGVFVVATHTDEHQKQYLRYLGLGDGPYYVLFEPYHLCHLEVIETILKVAYYNEPTINNSTMPFAKTVTLAKTDLYQGQKLDGIGGDTVYGMVDMAENVQDLLPVGFAINAIVKRDIKKDEPISINDVIIPVNAATRLAGLVKTASYAQIFSNLLYKAVNLF